MAQPSPTPLELNPVGESSPDLGRVRADLDYIRQTLEQAGTFSAVSGAGVAVAGIIGCVASALSWWWLGQSYGPRVWRAAAAAGPWRPAYAGPFLVIWVAAVALAAPLALWALYHKGRKWRLPLRRGPTGRALRSMAPGWLAAALLTLALAVHGAPQWLPGTWLLLAGLALLSAATFSTPPVRWLGRGLAVLGVVAFFLPSPAVTLACLALGFGVLHLIAGWWIARATRRSLEDAPAAAGRASAGRAR